MNRIKTIFALAGVALAQIAPAQIVAPKYKNAAGQVQDSQGIICLTAAGVECSFASGGGATSTDVSGTVTLGGTYQTVVAASGSRKGCLIQNPTTATEALLVKVGTMASPYSLAAGATFSCVAGSIVVTDAITITAATTGHAFSGGVQ